MKGNKIMARKVTLFTGQWADIPLKDLVKKASSWGYDGLELASSGDHFDVFEAAKSLDYCREKRKMLSDAGLNVWAISNHLAGQLICDLNDDARTDSFAPAELAGNAEGKRAWAVESMKCAARAAKNMGIDVVTGFTGSSIWHMLYSFPPVSEEMIEAGYRRFAELFNPILDVF